jgi:hypothetical protein
MTHRYWQGSPPSEDLEALQEYFRPAGPSEVSDSLYPQDVDLITDTERPLSPPTGPSVFEEAGLDREEFLELALQEPDVWNDGELDEIMAAYSGSGDEKRLEFLAREFLTGYRTEQLPPKELHHFAQTEEEIREELGLEDEDLDLTPESRSPSILSMEPGEGELDVGDWWISKDQKG